MSERPHLPTLITFDGEARSGKGTIVQAVKDALRDEHGYNVMLIDAGQVFRCLVVAASRVGVNLDDPAAIDAFLADDEQAEVCVQFVKDVYHMSKDDRDALLYHNEVSANSAKIGARPLSQTFKDTLLKKWLHDAANEGFEIVLLDGRALEEVGKTLETEGLCRFTMGLYFTCDAVVGARRTLGFATTPYSALSVEDRQNVDQLVEQIEARNDADRTRAVQPIVPPRNATILSLPDIEIVAPGHGRFMATIDTSANMSKQAMVTPVVNLIANHVNIDK